MMKNKFMYLLGLLLCLGFSACDDDDMEIIDPVPNPFEGCCATESFKGMIDTSNVYIPNMFTPNFDGINDIFLVHSGFGAGDLVKRFQIFDQDGFMLFEASNIIPNASQFYWSGRIGSTDSIYQGLFNYTIIYDTGISETEIKGSACSYACGSGSDQFPVANFGDCEFSGQHDGAGRFDQFLPTNEDDCF